MPEVIEWACVLGADNLVRNVYAEKDLDVVFQVGFRSWPSLPQNRVNMHRVCEVEHGFISSLQDSVTKDELRLRS